MHIRRSLRNVPERGRAEAALVNRIVGDPIAAEVFVLPPVVAQAEVVKAAVAERGAVVAVHAPGLTPKEVETEDFLI